MRDIIIKPVISEKSDLLSGVSNKYTFIVARKANKIQVGKALSEMYPEVTVLDVNTMVCRGKQKNRNTRTGLLKGRTQTVKKAIITLAEGDVIDIFETVEE
jgi:large subunit ribosomal protein L23